MGFYLIGLLWSFSGIFPLVHQKLGQPSVMGTFNGSFTTQLEGYDPAEKNCGKIIRIRILSENCEPTLTITEQLKLLVYYSFSDMVETKLGLQPCRAFAKSRCGLVFHHHQTDSLNLRFGSQSLCLLVKPPIMA